MRTFCSAGGTEFDKGSTTASYGYEYDGLGNIIKITKTIGGTTTDLYRYKYDEASQLVREDNCVTNQTTKWQYDIGGNIRNRTVYALTAENSEPSNAIDTIDYGYSTGIWKDLLTSYDGQSISYDASGNPTSYLGATMTWTMGRRLQTYNIGNLSVQYTYNQNGFRTSKTVNGSRTDYYLYGSRVIAEVTNGNRIDYRYDGNGQLITLRFNSNEYYYVTNIQGDIIGLIDGSGVSVVQYTYDAWGNQTSCTGTLANTLGQANPYRYRGYRFDSETGLYYLQSRYYDAELGRFVNTDRYIANSEITDKNLYLYCNNNPANFIDPKGEMRVAYLNFLCLAYQFNVINSITMSYSAFVLNGLGVPTALHEIAQMIIAKKLKTLGYAVYLEYPVLFAGEIDVVAAKGNSIYIWEVKTLYPKESPDNQLNLYTARTGFRRGPYISPVWSVQISRTIYMTVIFDGNGGAYYYLHTKYRRVENAEVIKAVRYGVLLASAAAGAIIIATLAEDAFTGGLGILDDAASLAAAAGIAGPIIEKGIQLAGIA